MLRKENVGFKKQKKALNSALLLTSLVDAFTILVIFLIVVATNSSDFEPTGKVILPQVTQSDAVTNAQKITVTPNQYIYNFKPLTIEQLRIAVLNDKQKFATHKAVIEADKKVSYAQIEPLMRLMSELEIETIQLAVESETAI